MRHPDPKLLEGTIKDLKFIIARNNSHHIIKYGKDSLKDFDRKAERIYPQTLNEVIAWFKDRYNVDLTDKLSEFKKTPNFNREPVEIVESGGNDGKTRKTRWNIGGMLKEGYYNIISKLSEYN